MLVAFQSGIKKRIQPRVTVCHVTPPPLFFFSPVPHGKFGPAHEVIVQRKTEGISSSSYLI